MFWVQILPARLVCNSPNSRTSITESLLFITNLQLLFELSSNDLLCFYKCVIRSVVEYGCVVWYHNLTIAQSE